MGEDLGVENENIEGFIIEPYCYPAHLRNSPTTEGSFDQIKSLFCVVYFLKYVQYWTLRFSLLQWYFGISCLVHIRLFEIG